MLRWSIKFITMCMPTIQIVSISRIGPVPFVLLSIIFMVIALGCSNDTDGHEPADETADDDLDDQNTEENCEARWDTACAYACSYRFHYICLPDCDATGINDEEDCGGICKAEECDCWEHSCNISEFCLIQSSCNSNY